VTIVDVAHRQMLTAHSAAPGLNSRSLGPGYWRSPFLFISI
jgi:hypothetical protein